MGVKLEAVEELKLSVYVTCETDNFLEPSCWFVSGRNICP